MVLLAIGLNISVLNMNTFFSSIADNQITMKIIPIITNIGRNVFKHWVLHNSLSRFAPITFQTNKF